MAGRIDESDVAYHGFRTEPDDRHEFQDTAADDDLDEAGRGQTGKVQREG